MKFIFSRLSKEKRKYMADVLRYYADKDLLMEYERATMKDIAKQLCAGQIEVKCEVSDPEYQVKSSNE